MEGCDEDTMGMQTQNKQWVVVANSLSAALAKDMDFDWFWMILMPPNGKVG